MLTSDPLETGLIAALVLGAVAIHVRHPLAGALSELRQASALRQRPGLDALLIRRLRDTRTAAAVGIGLAGLSLLLLMSALAPVPLAPVPLLATAVGVAMLGRMMALAAAASRAAIKETLDEGHRPADTARAETAG